VIAGAIDIGTNTTLALLAESDDGTLRPLRDELTANGLGDALSTEATLPAEVIALNVDLLAEIARDFRREGAEDFVVAGTSALRRAQNRADFLAAARHTTGLHVDIISGRDEAALTYVGALSNREIYPNERVCVMDLGGGSTEIVQGSGLSPGQGYSVDVGSSYLTNKFFLPPAPPTASDLQILREYLRDMLPPLVNTLRGTMVPWILVGGTVVTLAILKAGLRRYEPEKIGGCELNKTDVDVLIQRFIGRRAEELQQLPGMPLGRGRTILAGAILLDEMFAALNIERGIVSERGLRHGLWLAKFGGREDS
jgi:exopolyphosphatase / guanosine-5'-triphosphate,3'-diphosphate pyrophosphatase